MLTARRPRCEPNVTLPATSANRVSSPPRPTLMPGWKWVPRCRTMISPAFTDWPPKRLTPSRWALESRPLRELDAPFLCAMSAVLSWSESARNRVGWLLGRADGGDLELRQRLAVTHALVVA